MERTKNVKYLHHHVVVAACLGTTQRAICEGRDAFIVAARKMHGDAHAHGEREVNQVAVSLQRIQYAIYEFVRIRVASLEVAELRAPYLGANQRGVIGTRGQLMRGVQLSGGVRMAPLSHRAKGPDVVQFDIAIRINPDTALGERLTCQLTCSAVVAGPRSLPCPIARMLEATLFHRPHCCAVTSFLR